MILATSFRFDYSWVEADVWDDVGYPVTQGGDQVFIFLGLSFCIREGPESSTALKETRNKLRSATAHISTANLSA